MLSPATTDASKNLAACGVSEPRSASSLSRVARTTNLRMLTATKPREMPSNTTCRRWPSGNMASTNGEFIEDQQHEDRKRCGGAVKAPTGQDWPAGFSTTDSAGFRPNGSMTEGDEMSA
jgi:hypothetical protein